MVIESSQQPVKRGRGRPRKTPLPEQAPHKQTKKASATLFQRKLGVWFARAARIMDILEEQGIIWPQDGAKPREIYI